MRKVMELSDQIWKAMKKGDTERLRELIHEDAFFVHMGATLLREEELRAINKKEIVYKEIEFEEKTTNQFETTVVVLNKIKLTAVVGGVEVVNPFVVTEVYIVKDAAVKLISMSYTKIVY